jgi:hypothetical protein
MTFELRYCKSINVPLSLVSKSQTSPDAERVSSTLKRQLAMTASSERKSSAERSQISIMNGGGRRKN